MVKKKYYGYKEFLKDTKLLTKSVKEFEPNAILAVARGGLTLAHLMAQGLNNRNILTLNSIHYDNTQKLDSIKITNIPDLNKYQRVVIVDDIIDSGDTMLEIYKLLSKEYSDIDFKIASLFYKKSAKIQPHYTIREAKEWIDFFWEVDNILNNYDKIQ